MVTAELAVVLPALVLAVAVAVGVSSAATVRLRCLDAAAVAARAAARGETAADVHRLAGSVAPGGAVVTVARADGGTVVVSVSAPVPVPLLGRLGLLPVVRERFVEALEPGAADVTRGGSGATGQTAAGSGG